MSSYNKVIQMDTKTGIELKLEPIAFKKPIQTGLICLFMSLLLLLLFTIK